MTIEELYTLIESRKKEMPKNSYTSSLFKEGEDRIIQKVGEESVEVIIAAKNRDKKEIIYETSDLIFHLMVMLSSQNISINKIFKELERRHKK